jgi:16S rRNA processing protein RimM
MNDFVTIARLIKPRGIRGEIVADLLTDFPDRFEGLEIVTAVFPDGKQAELKIEGFWFQKGRIILKLAGYDSPESVETLRGAQISVPEDEAVELEEGAYFDWQLAGCEVETTGGEKLGTVSELMRTGGTELLVVKAAGSNKDYLIPFAESICPVVDVENKLIKVDPPEGLLEF